MGEQIRKENQRRITEGEAARMTEEARQRQEAEVGSVAVNAETEKLKRDTDEILDDIDSILENNADLFVKNYIQKGGE